MRKFLEGARSSTSVVRRHLRRDRPASIGFSMLLDEKSLERGRAYDIYLIELLLCGDEHVLELVPDCDVCLHEYGSW